MDGKQDETMQMYQDCLASINESLARKLEARNAAVNGRDEHLIALEADIRNNPNDSFAFYRIGCYQYHEAELDKSVEYFIKAINLNPSNAMKHAVELKLKASKISKAIKDALEMCESKKEEPALELLAAATHLDTKNVKVQQKIADTKAFIQESIAKRLQAEAEEKVATERRVESIKQLLMNKNYLDAGDELDLVREGSISAEVHKFLKGKVEYIRGDMNKAVPLLEEVVKMNSEHLEAPAMLALARTIKDHVDRSIDKLNEKNYKEGIEILTKLIKIDESHTKIIQAAYFQRSLAHYSILKTKEAVADFKKYYALQPRD